MTRWIVKLLGGERPPDPVPYDGPGLYAVKVSGTSHYQDALEKIAGGKTEDGLRPGDLQVTALAAPDALNPVDPRTVAIWIDGHHVGHLPANLHGGWYAMLRASGLHPRTAIQLNAELRGGWRRGDDEGSYGVRLDLDVT